MIGSLRGRLVDRGIDGELLIEVGGVGYRVQVAPVTSVALGAEGDDVFVWVHHRVREDGQTLFGFADKSERECFEAMLGAHGVGPALALAILGVHAPAELFRILADGDADALCLVPGVGKKTAARLLVELESRLDVDTVELPRAVAGAGPGPAGNGASRARADVRNALAELDYSAEEIGAAMRDLPDTDDPAALLRVALATLGSPR
ncbi:MAG TPA: Holliday junction branch migration protein RuvA [Acidimicrobiales bacterium]|nr:Holliday junction branch migration protein RuvA [Acidimicrobiales bacterium]